MAKHEHTSGPWTVNPLGVDFEANSIFADTLANGRRRLIATVSTGADAPANARLIALRIHTISCSATVLTTLLATLRVDWSASAISSNPCSPRSSASSTRHAEGTDRQKISPYPPIFTI